MPRSNKPTKELSLVQATKAQQDIVDLLNPEIALKKRAVIEKSRHESKGEWIDLANLPEKYKYLTKIKNFDSIKPCAMQLRPGRDMEKSLKFFIENSGVAHTGNANYGGSDKRASGKSRKNSPEVEEMMEEMI